MIKPSLTTVANVGKVVVALAGTLIMTELGVQGASMLEQDVKAGKALVDHARDPKVYKVKKKGLFKKSETVTINPVTGKAKPYKGDKKPVNKKAIKY